MVCKNGGALCNGGKRWPRKQTLLELIDLDLDLFVAVQEAVFGVGQELDRFGSIAISHLQNCLVTVVVVNRVGSHQVSIEVVFSSVTASFYKSADTMTIFNACCIDLAHELVMVVML